MNIKKIESLLRQIENADFITVDDSPNLHYVSADEFVEDEPDHAVLEPEWNDEEGQYYSTTFTEENFDKANFKDNLIMLHDNEGNNCIITLFESAPAIIIKNW